MTQISVCQSQSKSNSVYPPPLSAGGVQPPTKFKKGGGGLTGPQILEGVAGKEEGDFFQAGGASVT